MARRQPEMNKRRNSSEGLPVKTLVDVIDFTKITCTIKSISTVFARVSIILDWINAETSSMSTYMFALNEQLIDGID